MAQKKMLRVEVYAQLQDVATFKLQVEVEY